MSYPSCDPRNAEITQSSIRSTPPDSPTSFQDHPAHELSAGLPRDLRLISPDEFKAEVLSRALCTGPLATICLRHGRSAGNEKENIAALGAEYSELKKEYEEFDDHDLPLVPMGIEQSIAAGRTLAHLVHTGLLPKIDRALTSLFTRPKETLSGVVIGIRRYGTEHGISVDSIIDLSAPVEMLPALGERYWGDFNEQDDKARHRGYADREDSPLFWTPGLTGERLDELLSRTRSVFSKLYRPSYAGKVVLLSTHGEWISGAEIAVHELDPFGDQFKRSFKTGIPNCGMFIFSRAAFKPEMTAPDNALSAGFSYYMKVVPYELTGWRAEQFAEWALAPQWRERVSTRVPLKAYPESVTLSASSRDIAEKLRKAGVGLDNVEPRF